MSIKINENRNLLNIVSRARGSLSALAEATRRISSSLGVDRAADQPSVINQVTLGNSQIREISRELKALNEGISAAQQTDSYLVEIETLLGRSDIDGKDSTS